MRIVARPLVGTMAAIMMFFTAAAAANHDGPGLSRETLPHLTVRGQASLEKPADQLQITIGVVTEHTQATTALQQNNEKMRAVVDALDRAGLREKEYQTGQFQIHPVYSRRPPRADQEWTPTITGYRVTNSVQVKTPQLDAAGKIIQMANAAGANTIDNISFGLASPRKYRQEAISEAVRQAMEDARTLSQAASLRIIRIVSIRLDPEHTPPPMPMHRAVAMEAADGPPIVPGDVTVRATVNIVYEIGPQE